MPVRISSPPASVIAPFPAPSCRTTTVRACRHQAPAPWRDPFRDAAGHEPKLFVIADNHVAERRRRTAQHFRGNLGRRPGIRVDNRRRKMIGRPAALASAKARKVAAARRLGGEDRARGDRAHRNWSNPPPRHPLRDPSGSPRHRCGRLLIAVPLDPALIERPDELRNSPPTGVT